MAEFRLGTPRLVLRDWREADWAVMRRLTNTPAVMRWLGGVADEAGWATFRQRVESYRRDHGHTFWALWRADDNGHLAGELLGMCGLKRSNQPGGPQGDHEIGWRLRDDSWGHGYAREAACAVRDLAFTRLAAPHLLALTVAGNAPSRGLMQRIGMERCEQLDFDSADFGGDRIIAYRQTRAQWEALA